MDAQDTIAAAEHEPVRRQYEAAPCPEREAADAARRLIEGSPWRPSRSAAYCSAAVATGRGRSGRWMPGEIAGGERLAFGAARAPVHRGLTEFNLMHYSTGARR